MLSPEFCSSAGPRDWLRLRRAKAHSPGAASGGGHCTHAREMKGEQRLFMRSPPAPRQSASQFRENAAPR